MLLFCVAEQLPPVAYKLTLAPSQLWKLDLLLTCLAQAPELKLRTTNTPAQGPCRVWSYGIVGPVLLFFQLDCVLPLLVVLLLA